MVHHNDKGNGMIKQGHLIQYNWESQISNRRVREGLSKKMTEPEPAQPGGHGKQVGK